MGAWRRAVLVIVVAALVLAACSSKKDSAAQSAGTTTSSTGPAATRSTTRSTTPPTGVTAADIAVAHTPPGGYGTTLPAPILARCTEPLVKGAPDMRGWWKVAQVEVGGKVAPRTHPAYKSVQRIEQCGNRVVVTASGVVHDMRCDGTQAHGVHDVAEKDKKTPLTVVCTFEKGVHILRPVGIKVEVTRRRDGAQIYWVYLGFNARLERTGPPDGPPPSV
ncbi:MAG: hypothetical protein JWM05_459 [Acidimicrobiales bacterium]|nr:hypothetical protein [Acidimicrobiales bacterium]